MAASHFPLLAVLMIPFLASSLATLQQTRYSKIVGVVHDTLCRLSVFTPYGNQMSVKNACSIQCMKTTDCRFFCIGVDGNTCDMYESYVAVRFPGHASGTTYSSCYTSWGDPRDVIKTNTPTTYSSLFASSYSSDYAKNGVACVTCPYFVTQLLTNSFFQLDLGSEIRVNSVTAVVALANHYNDIVIYLGNSTSYSSNAVYGRGPGTVPAWTSNTIVGNTSIAGRYLTIFSPHYAYLGFCELQVIRN